MIDTSSAESVESAIAENEPGIVAAVEKAIDQLLTVAKNALLAGTGIPDLGAWPSIDTWIQAVNEYIITAVREIFAAFAGIDTQQYTQQYLDNVSSRLRDFDSQAFEEVRYELLEGLDAGESTRELRDRVGEVLDLNAVSRRIQADISALTQQINAETDPVRERELRAERRSLYRDADREERRWLYRADRIARTETTGAVNAGVYADGISRLNTGESGLFKQWWATSDTRVRPAHWVAHGQVVAMGDPFSIGGWDLDFPGDPRGPANQVINCRCALLVLREEEALRQRADYEGNRPNRTDIDGNLLDDSGNPIVT